MTDTLILEIVTPEGTILSEPVKMVTVPTVVGQIGILPRHIRLMTQAVPGEMIVHTAGVDRFLAVGSGLIDVTGDKVVVVTDMAIAVERIDEELAQEARD